MRINELTTYQGTPGADDYLAIDNGIETMKVSANNLGVTTEMTKEEAVAGASTQPRVIQPSIFKEAVDELLAAKAAELVTEAKVTILVIGGLDSLPLSINASNVTADMVVLKAEFSNPAAQTSEWDVSTSNGSITISGTITGATDLTLYLMKANV